MSDSFHIEDDQIHEMLAAKTEVPTTTAQQAVVIIDDKEYLAHLEDDPQVTYDYACNRDGYIMQWRDSKWRKSKKEFKFKGFDSSEWYYVKV